MSKTLAIVLNHNLPEYTNWVYYSLQKFANDSIDLKVMDNGSKPELIPKYTHIRLPKNIYWGGALNEAFSMVLKDSQYDSLLFLNNDIEFNPEIFFRRLRDSMFRYDLAIATPCISGKPQPWRQMQNWGSQEPRLVRWIDNQAPLIHRKVIEAIVQFPDALRIGWGQELICYEVCRDHGWKIAVLDYVDMIHFGKQTVLQNRLFKEDNHEGSGEEAVEWETFKAEALRSRDIWFEQHPLKYETLQEQVDWALTYRYMAPADVKSATPIQDQTKTAGGWRKLFGWK